MKNGSNGCGCMLLLMAFAAVAVICVTDSIGLTSVGSSIERTLEPEPVAPPSGFLVTVWRTFSPPNARNETERFFGSVTKYDYFFVEHGSGSVTPLGTAYSGIPAMGRW